MSASCGIHEAIPNTDVCPTCEPPDGWQTQALCAQSDPELWFPENHQAPGTALTVCNRCPVRAYCLELGWDEPYGVWGGYTATSRETMRRWHRDKAPKERRAIIRSLAQPIGAQPDGAA